MCRRGCSGFSPCSEVRIHGRIDMDAPLPTRLHACMHVCRGQSDIKAARQLQYSGDDNVGGGGGTLICHN